MIDNQKKKKKEGEEHLLHWAKMRVKHFSLPQRNGIRRMFATVANARSSSLVYFFLLLRPEAWRLPRRGEKHPRQHLPWGCRPALGGGTGPRRAVSSPAVAVLAEVGGPTVQGDARQDAVTSHGGGRCPRTGLCHRDLSLQWLCLSGERESDIRS